MIEKNPTLPLGHGLAGALAALVTDRLTAIMRAIVTGGAQRAISGCRNTNRRRPHAPRTGGPAQSRAFA
ncbi:hypothetical protein GC209_07985 [bacterium]|nr:hypothetical protein [bacterium]